MSFVNSSALLNWFNFNKVLSFRKKMTHFLDEPRIVLYMYIFSLEGPSKIEKKYDKSKMENGDGLR